MIIQSVNRPDIVLKVARGNFYQFIIRIDLKEIEGIWECQEIEIPIGQWGKDIIYRSIMDVYYTDDEENKIILNAIQTPEDASVILKYKNLQAWRKNATSWAFELMEYAYNNNLSVIDPYADIPTQYNNPKPQGTPEWFTMVSDGLKLLKKQALTLTDEEAIEVPTLFPAWIDKIGEEILQGERLYYNGDVWKVRISHTVVEENNPYSSPDLYEQLSEYSGTEEYPIPRQYAVDFENGKTYSDGKQLYIGQEVGGEVDLVAIKDRVPLIP